MPIYEYQCAECGARFEEWRRIGDPQPGLCPNGHPKVHRLFSQPAIIFKGSGFYATDHGRNGGGRSQTKRHNDKVQEPPAAASAEKELPSRAEQANETS